MLGRRLLLLLGAGILISLPSCGLVKAPFRVVGAVAEGTAKMGKKAATATADAFGKTEEEKAEDAKKKAKEEAAGKAKEKAAEPGELPVPTPAEPPPEPLPEDFLPPLPGTDQPLPGDEALPYQGQ